MITLFRRIREKLIASGSLTKYLLYAVGEILLVVIGILIALQVNNWNEQRNRQANIRNYVRSMVSDIQQDQAEIDIRIAQIKDRILRVNSFAEYMRNRSFEEVDNLDLMIYTKGSFTYRPFTWYRSSIEEITSSGSLKDIDDPELRDRIVAYYALQDHLDEDFQEDKRMGSQIEQYVAEIVKMNYPDWEVMYDESDILQYLDRKEWLDNQVYRKYKSYDYDLLINDNTKLDELVNVSFRFVLVVANRSASELPRLKQQGQEIIDLIEDRYGD
ncbi:DUF6090 family protein [Balneola sp. MJW-20]|uniref:DUF6090 family protein n=1 Tax=Gracilimonas aurantiaca TaxID=3234185 RepID=UPI003466DA04